MDDDAQIAFLFETISELIEDVWPVLQGEEAEEMAFRLKTAVYCAFAILNDEKSEYCKVSFGMIYSNKARQSR